MMSIYVALEGIEGTGKSTLLGVLPGLLARDDCEVVAVREPGGTGAGEAIRHVLLSHDFQVAPWTEVMLFAAQRAQLAAEVIAPALARGAVVIGDRSVYSSLAYQGGGRELGVDEVRRVNEAALRGTWPDLVLLLELDAASGLEREDAADRISVDGADLIERVGRTYDLLAEAEPDRFVRVDASLPFDDVVARCHAEIRSRL